MENPKYVRKTPKDIKLTRARVPRWRSRRKLSQALTLRREGIFERSGRNAAGRSLPRLLSKLGRFTEALLAMLGALAIFVALPADMESFRPSAARFVDKAFPGYLLKDAASSVFAYSNVSVLESKVIAVSRSSNQYIVFGRYMTEQGSFYRDVYFIEQGVYQPLLHLRHDTDTNVVQAIARDDGTGIYYFEGATQGTGGFDAGGTAYRLSDSKTLIQIPVHYQKGDSEKARWEGAGSSVFLFTDGGSSGRLVFSPNEATVSGSSNVRGIVGVPVLTFDDSGGAQIGEAEVESVTLAVGDHLIMGKAAVPHEITGDSAVFADIIGEFSLIRAVKPGTAEIHLNLSYRDPETEYALVDVGRTFKIHVSDPKPHGAGRPLALPRHAAPNSKGLGASEVIKPERSGSQGPDFGVVPRPPR